jgi:hypothetical protein
MLMRSLAATKTYLEGTKRLSKQLIDAFVKRMTANPVYELTHSRDEFEHAARLELAEAMLKLIAEGEDRSVAADKIVAEVQRIATKQLLRGGQMANNYSTSATVNLMDASQHSALATFVEWLTQPKEA